MAPWRFGSKFFKTGFTFPVALIQNEKIKVEHVSILMGHPVQYGNNGCGVFKGGIQNQKDFGLKINCSQMKLLNFEN